MRTIGARREVRRRQGDERGDDRGRRPASAARGCRRASWPARRRAPRSHDEDVGPEDHLVADVAVEVRRERAEVDELLPERRRAPLHRPGSRYMFRVPVVHGGCTRRRSTRTRRAAAPARGCRGGRCAPTAAPAVRPSPRPTRHASSNASAAAARQSVEHREDVREGAQRRPKRSDPSPSRADGRMATRATKTRAQATRAVART